MSDIDMRAREKIEELEERVEKLEAQLAQPNPCPICKGFGYIRPQVGGDVPMSMPPIGLSPCHHCNGTGKSISLLVKTAEPAPSTDKLLKAIDRLALHRNIPCSGDTRCADKNCDKVIHNHLVFKTEAARDDYAALIALRDKLEGE